MSKCLIFSTFLERLAQVDFIKLNARGWVGLRVIIRLELCRQDWVKLVIILGISVNKLRSSD